MVDVLFFLLLISVMNCQPGWGSQGTEESRRKNHVNVLHGPLRRDPLGAKAMRRDYKDTINTNVGGPKIDEFYKPSIGYEPYWAGGDWVLPVYAPVGGACGKICSPVYLKYGVICGWNREFEHKTFENYCQLKNEDCDGTKGWLVVYRGECQLEIQTHPTRAKDILSRAYYWIDRFSSQPYGNGYLESDNPKHKGPYVNTATTVPPEAK